MAKTFDDLVSRTMSKASQKRATERTKVLLREMLLSELRQATWLQPEEAGDEAEDEAAEPVEAGKCA